MISSTLHDGGMIYEGDQRLWWEGNFWYMKLTSVEFQDTQSITVSLLLGVSTLDGEKQMNYIIFSWKLGLPRKEKDANILKFYIEKK